jgi:TRAP-type C4-dicarboxylate transport system permease small subunit
MADATGRFERIATTINKKANWIACGAAAIMMAFVCCDIILRYFGHPIKGSNDVVQLLSVLLVAFAMGYTQVLKRHASVSLVISRFSPRAQGIIASITSILSIGLFIMVAWQIYALAGRTWLSGELSMTLRIPFYPLIYGLALGCVLMCLVLAVDFLKSLGKAVRG